MINGDNVVTIYDFNGNLVCIKQNINIDLNTIFL